MEEYEEGKALFQLIEAIKIPLEIAWCGKMIEKLKRYRKGLKALNKIKR